MLERAVRRCRARKGAKPLRRIGVDEMAIAKGHRYHTRVGDLEAGTVEHVENDRKQESLEAFYRTLFEEQKAGLEAIAMDRWAPYIQVTLAQVPEAADKIVFDRFHIMRHLGKAVDQVRKAEHRELLQRGDKRLKGSKYLWVYAKERVPAQRRREFAALRRADLKVARAWALKEHFRRLWRFVRLGWALAFWRAWYWWATHSRLRPMRQVAETLKRHLHNILTYLSHPITNAALEGIDGKI